MNWDNDIVTVRDALPRSMIDGFTGETPHPARVAFERIVAEAGRVKTEVLNQDITATATRLELDHLREVLAQADKGLADATHLINGYKAEIEKLRAEQDNAGFIPWRLAQDSIDEATAEVERLKKRDDFITREHALAKAEIERLQTEIARYKADPTLLLDVDESKVIYLPEEDR